MKTLSLDQSFTATGVVLWQDSEVIDFKVVTSDKSKKDYVRVYDIGCELESLIKEVDLVVLESLSYGSFGNASRNLAGLYFYIKVLCHINNVEVMDMSPTSVKKFATGSGKAKKKDMWEALPEDIQIRFSEKYKTIKSGKHDLADSFFIGKMGLEKKTNKKGNK